MDKRKLFDQQKEKRIQDLLEKASQTEILKEKYLIFNEVINEYQFYSFDKALHYIEQNLEIAENLKNNLYLNKTKLTLSLLLIDSGRYKESIDALNEIKRDSLPISLTNDYYIAYKEGYAGLSYNTYVKRSKAIYSELYTAYQDSLYSRLDPNSEESLRLQEKQFRDQRKLDEALKINSQRLKEVKMGFRGFSLITFERSLLYELKNDNKKQKEYLILSAISDIEASVKDNASIGTLAKIMFAEGDIDRAHQYVNFSFEDAEFYNSQLRYVNIANSLPMISKAYEERSEKQKAKLQDSLIFISVLAGFLLIAIYLVFKQVRKVSDARNKLKNANEKLKYFNEKLNASNEDLKRLYLELSESDKVKEHYIGTFLNLYSEYITKLDVYRKLVRKYVNTNQMKSLLELSKSKQFIDEELEIFNKNFDNSFLHIYPNFVKHVNELLKPEEQIILKENSKLNTELRILALIKLGINNSSRIAKILRYSVNTIYNYRASIKSASKDKTTFEEMIKNIQ
ncbi:hypothetical protein KORDIASMS9_02916 [Kordia sp. SMS9]|uniref:DUF6377 domain-containing protein n=1 Tax=Kordia sp. SMS9 TaxID=2282170 RepID=UPI000E10136D|nr:DUF6377 domain-containing protein [Kordia sp. SMS9]AXG70672.1 hypothetical protein KORDIASMS9_02916 [Kordia sp. SMS9]